MTTIHFFTEERTVFMKNFKKLTAIITSIVALSTLTAFNASADCESTTYTRGDVNLDGVVNTADFNALNAGIYWISPLSDTQLMVADVNADGHVNIADAVYFAFGSFARDEITVNTDENGNVAFLLNGQDSLRINSDSWNAEVSNENGSDIQLSRYGMSLENDNGYLDVNPWNSAISYDAGDASFYMSSNDWYTGAKTSYDGGKGLGTAVSVWGDIQISHDEMAEETAPFMRKTYNYFNYINKDNAMFTETGYGIDDTVYLANAEVTKRTDGVEFVNYVSNKTVNSFMADDYVTIDGVTLSYADGEFTIDGIPEDEIELLHTMTVDQYDEIAIMTNTPGNRFIYGLMYDKDSSSMAALVKVRLDEDMEATVIQYSKPADMATTINFYPKEDVYERAMANPDEIVTLFDTQYDPTRLVFQTVHFPRMTKNTLAGSLNARYQITSGITYKQTAGNASIKTTYNTSAQTMSFNSSSDGFSIESSENGTVLGMTFSADSSSYKFGGETLSVAGGERFDPETEVSYNFGEITADFTAEDVLAQHVPFRY